MPRRRRNLGSSAAEHKNNAESYRNVYLDDVKRMHENLQDNRCSAALDSLMSMAEMSRGFKAHSSAFSRGLNQRRREARQMDAEIAKQTILFRRQCMR